MNDAEYSVRKEIIATCLAMEKKGINQGTSGNVSVRWDDGLLVTPSGLSYDMMAPEEIIYVERNGTPHGPHSPSSEWRFHRDIMLARPDIQAIVHAHPSYCTAHAILGRGIPAVHYMIAAAGGPTHSLRSLRDLRHRRTFPRCGRRARRPVGLLVGEPWSDSLWS